MIHTPRRERDHHAYVLDTAQTGGPEVIVMREIWAPPRNEALERAGEADRDGIVAGARRGRGVPR